MRFITKPIASALIVCLVHNPIAGFYLWTGLLFFKPFPAFADAFLDRAAEGQAFGTGLMTGYSIPNVNSSTGQMTLTNGLVAGQTVQQGELFQEIQPGSMDGIAASYGDSAALGTNVNNDLGSLTTGTSTHAYAYQTLMGANTAMPNMYNDPMWKPSDDIYSLKSPLINDLFNGCEKKTSFSETSCPIHLEDLKTCKKTLKTEACKVTRIITPLANETIELASFTGTGGSGNGGFNEIAADQMQIMLGTSDLDAYPEQGVCNPRVEVMTINVNDTSRLISAVIATAGADDNVKLTIDGAMVFNSGDCDDRDPWISSFNIDVMPYLTNGTHTLVMYTYAADVSSYGGWVLLDVKKQVDLEESFTDYPAGCRERLFDNWPPTGTTAPPFVSDGSLNDQASTDWWKCTDASNSRTFGGITITPDSPVLDLQPILPDPPPSPPAPICYAAETRVPGHITLPCFTDKDGYQVCPEYDYDLEEHTSCDQVNDGEKTI